MCTVSFLARQRGYRLAMNRDELRTRPAGLPPKLIAVGQRQVVCPAEPGGGTWIALNDAGVTFALINWYAIKANADPQAITRGCVVRAVCAQTLPTGAAAVLERLALQQIKPFRLLGVFPTAQALWEWRWDTKSLSAVPHPWETTIWISSGFDEPGAQRARKQVFDAARRQKSVGTLDWLRRLHRSHRPERGPYSICMHRPEAATVSYTEVSVGVGRGRMSYQAEAPCAQASWISLRI